MTTIPMSLFKHGMMRKPDKVALRNHLITAQCEMKETSKQVLDGGTLMHKVRWEKDVTFPELCKQYVNFVRSKFGQCAVVFDGYEAGPSTKDHEHGCRSVKNRGAVEFIFNKETKVKANQDAFLSNEKNKARFIKMLSEFLIADRQTVGNCKEDADTKIVKCVIDFAEHCDVNVVANDTDVALLLLFHWKPLLHKITFTSEKKYWNIRDVVSALQDRFRSYIMVLHTFTGCDTTSAIYAKGKTSFLKKIFASNEIRDAMEVISDPWAKPFEVGDAGHKLLLNMYGGTGNDNLITKRFAFGTNCKF